MTIELVEVKVDTDINRKTVVVFDPEYDRSSTAKSPHREILRELFPKDTLFCGINFFTLMALKSGMISPGLQPSDLVPLNPALFILNLKLIPSVSIANPALTLLKNLAVENRLCEVKRVIVTDSRITSQLSRKLAELGVPENSVFSWSAFASTREFGSMVKTLV